MGHKVKFIVEKFNKSKLHPDWDYIIYYSPIIYQNETNPMDEMRLFLIDTVGTYGQNYNNDPWYYSTYSRSLYVREKELSLLAMKFEFK